MARKPRSPKKLPIQYDLYDQSHPRLKELVLVNVLVKEDVFFDLLLTRVPSIGEEINREDRSYKITRVRHEPVDPDGRARFGWHAFVDAELLPEDIIPPKKPKRQASRNRKPG